jgi:putative ATP-dependent endonuclease of OLD family
MKISRIVIQNYKSVRSIVLECSHKINAFIGENSSGKSNIFNAINWVLGPVYPTFNYTSAIDHYLGDTANKIKIELTFSDGNYLCLDEEGFNGRPGLKYSGNANGGINDETRTRLYGSASLGIDRQIVDYLPSNRWSLMGRMLLEINELFKQEEITDESSGEVLRKPDYLKRELETIRDEVLFTVRDSHGVEVMKQFVETLQQESAKQLARPIEDFKVDLNLYDPWNFYRTLQLLVKESGTNLEFQASNLGMGVQASISIAILKAYSRIKLNNNTPIFRDEPELFLHPQAQRNFYKVLCELAESGVQVFYTTHSPDFLNVGRFNEIFLVRKNAESGTYVRYAKPKKFVDDLLVRNDIQTNDLDLMLQYKNAYDETGDTQKANEAFFAKKIILVEGQSESLCLPYLFDKLGYDYIGKSISIVRCGNKGELDRFYRLYTEFGIPSYIVFDGDKQHENTDASLGTIAKNKSILKLFGIENVDFPDNTVQEKHLSFKNTFNENLGFVTTSKSLKLFKEVRSRIQTQEHVPSWVRDLTIRLDALPDTISSVLLQPN